MFYGWYIVAASAVLMACHGAILMYGFTAFINPIATTFGWSYAQIAFATSLRGLEAGALNPFFGAAVDRWPAKKLVLIGMIVYGLGLFLVGQATSLIMFYLAFLIAALGSSLAVQMVPPTMIARWFRKNIGLASGTLTMGIGIGGLLIPLLVKLIDTYGWQNTLTFLAAGVWVLGIPLSFVFRNRPEEHGLLPDGKPQDNSKGPDSLSAYDFSTSVREALKMPAFWYIGVATIFQTAGAGDVESNLGGRFTDEASTSGQIVGLTIHSPTDYPSGVPGTQTAFSALPEGGNSLTWGTFLHVKLVL